MKSNVTLIRSVFEWVLSIANLMYNKQRQVLTVVSTAPGSDVPCLCGIDEMNDERF